MTEPDFSLRDDGIELTMVHPEHYQYLYWLSLSEFNNVRWRYRGQLPPFEVFVQQLQADVLVQFMVQDASTGRRLGHCVAYSADLRNRHCYIGVLMDPSHIGIGAGSIALRLLTSYLFRTWDLHKVYAEVPAFTLETMQGKLNRLSTDARAFEIEATMKEYLYHDGKMWDMYVVSATATSWRAREHEVSIDQQGGESTHESQPTQIVP